MRIEEGKAVADFDPHFKIFHELMPFKVKEILLVSSPYDAFIMEEDGSLATRLINEYQGLNLSGAPRITLVSSGTEAIERLRRKSYELVITMANVGGMDAFVFGAEVKKLHPQQHIVLISHSLRNIYPVPERAECNGIDNIYFWCCQSDLLLAVIKNFEDHVNVDSDTRRAMVRVIIMVEDSPVYRSYLLPMIYREVVRQTQAVLDDSLNESHRLLRMRARPKILSAINYEEAMILYESYKPYVFGVISDARFPRGGKMDPEAGLRFLQTIRNETQDLPMLMFSSEIENREAAEAVPAVFLHKESPHVKNQISEFFVNYLGFGDFVFRAVDGRDIGHASNLYEFEKKLREIPDESICYHVGRNHFSHWVMARAEVALATRLHSDHVYGLENVDQLREDLIFKVHSLRRLRQQGVVVKFSRDKFDPDIVDFVKIGKGSMGGKARGLAFMWMQLQRSRSVFPSLQTGNVTLPKTCVVAADGFDDFVLENGLSLDENLADEDIANQFLEAELPNWLRDDLQAYLAKVHHPISVRSSSLLEDAHFRPYAGLYSTFFLSNNHPSFSLRCQQLERAVKLVYASTWFENPRSYSRWHEQGREDSMAVILQQVVGDEYEGFFYPHISGVAQSYNYYPVMQMKAEEGICHIALGVGKMVVEGEQSLRFSPAYPKRLVQFSTVEDILANSQRQFYALNMSFSQSFEVAGSNLVRRHIQDAENESPVRQLASTYIADEHRIRDGIFPGLKVVSFASVLKYNLYPLAEVIKELLVVGRRGMGCEVEIEFGVRLAERPEKSIFYVLQIRPMVTGGEQSDVAIREADIRHAFCCSESCLGHGVFSGMADIIMVRPDACVAGKTMEVAREINLFNGRLRTVNRSYLLMGPGRWGSADPWLGVPVQWHDISGVGAIVELHNDMFHADPSQGSHFFQNITSLGIPYLTVRDNGAENNKCGDTKVGNCVDWDFLMAQSDFEDGVYVRHIRFASPFVLKCDGKKETAVGYFAEG